MRKFNFKSQIGTDINQSKRLLALGLKEETADCHYPISMLDSQPCGCVRIGNPFEQNYHAFPAWSLHRLIQMITDTDLQVTHSVGVNIFDPFGKIIDCIEWLIKEGHFNKEYLCQEEKK